MRHARDVLAPEALESLAAYRRSLERSLPGLVKRIVLFGSRARGDAAADSDFDIAVFLDRNEARKKDVREEVADAAFTQMIDSFEVSAIALPDDYLQQAGGHFRNELARRIAEEGLDVD